VILTGTGQEFILGIDVLSFGKVADAGVWSQVHDKRTQILGNLGKNPTRTDTVKLFAN